MPRKKPKRIPTGIASLDDFVNTKAFRHAAAKWEAEPASEDPEAAAELARHRDGLRPLVVRELNRIADKLSEAHSKSGRAPRSNLRKVVARVVKQHATDWTLKDLKPYIEDAIGLWNDEHDEQLGLPGDKYLGELIRKARAKRL